MLGEDIDPCFVKNLAVRDFDSLKARIFHWRPQFDCFVSTAAKHMLSIIVYRELRRVYFSGVPLQTVNKLSILSIQQPNQEILATCDEYVALWVPFQKVHILAGPVFHDVLEFEVIFGIPDPNLIVHSASGEQLRIMIKLNELYGLSMT